MKPRLLIVDDEQRMVDIVAMVLRREGHDVSACTDPEAALAMLDDQAFDPRGGAHHQRCPWECWDWDGEQPAVQLTCRQPE